MNIKVIVDDGGLINWLNGVSYIMSMGNWNRELPLCIEEKMIYVKSY